MRDEDKTKEQLLEELRGLRAQAARPPLPVERLPLAYLWLDAEFRVLDWNPAAEQMFGYARAEVLGRVVFDLIVSPPLAAPLQELVRLLQAGDMQAHSVNENRTKDGRVLLCEWFNTPLADTDGRFAGVIALARDVTALYRGQAAQEANRRRFHAVFENALDPILLMDDRGHYVDANPAACELLGYRRDELLRLSVWDVTPAALRTRVPELLLYVFSVGSQCGEHVLLSKGGATRVVEFRSAANILPGLHLSVLRDITERKRAEEELRRQKERVSVQMAELEQIYRHAPVGLVFVDPQLRFVRINEQLAAMNGKPVAAHLGRTVREVLPELADAVEPPFRRAIDTGEPVLGVEVHGTTAAEPGVRRDWLGNFFPLRSAGGAVIGVTAAVMEITRRKRAEEKLRAYSNRVQALSRRLLTVQEQERRHLARELHDEVGQLLTGLKFALEAGAAAPREAAVAKLAEARALIDEALTRVRNLSFDLRPALLDHLGLLPALRGLIERYTACTGIRVDFKQAGPARRLAPEVETAAYRVVQEALTNVARHARVHEAVVRVWEDDDTLKIQVEDQGAGFDHEATLAEGRSNGLPGVAERARLLGGRLTVESSAGNGTCLLAELPLSEPDGERPLQGAASASGVRGP